MTEMRGARMTPTMIDPRQIAKTFQMDTYELADQLASWAYTALPGYMFNSEDVFGPMPLDDFDAAVEKARRYLVDSHESMKAWLADHPTSSDVDA